MRRLLTVLMVSGLIAAACSGGNTREREFATDEEGAVESQPAGEPAATHGDDEEVTPDERGPDADPAEQTEALPSTTITVLAEEMMLDELNVAYFPEWPTANLAVRAEGSYDEALDLTVNWIPFPSGDDMVRAMEDGEIDIAYSQDVTSVARSVGGGAALLVVGVAVGYLEAVNVAGTEQAEVGIVGFGVVSTTRDFAAEYPDAVTGFLQVTDEAYKAYNQDREPLIDIIAEVSGLDHNTTITLLNGFTFPERDEQLSGTWLGGTVQQVVQEQMDLLIDQGVIESALGSYDDFVDTSFLEAVD